MVSSSESCFPADLNLTGILIHQLLGFWSAGETGDVVSSAELSQEVRFDSTAARSEIAISDVVDAAECCKQLEHVSSIDHKPTIDKDLMTKTFLRYKGAEEGEVDWRPIETTPEDYYAL